jgi:hypothetical protein
MFEESEGSAHDQPDDKSDRKRERKPIGVETRGCNPNGAEEPQVKAPESGATSWCGSYPTSELAEYPHASNYTAGTVERSSSVTALTARVRLGLQAGTPRPPTKRRPPAFSH